MNVADVNWGTLERLRRGFLEGTAGREDYWRNLDDLAAYDATFAQRIGWKWDFVLSDIRALGWRPPAGPVLDWGCGSGIAARAFLDHLGPLPPGSAIHFADRSPKAVEYALRRCRERFGPQACSEGFPVSPAVLLISHVLTELNSDHVNDLLALARRATSVVWVEPGTYEASLALIAIRERLTDIFHPVAPCPCPGRCGILAPGNETHWCHHFAEPPRGVFTDPFWGRFANLLGIDLRSVPLSYLVLDRRSPPTTPPATLRKLGRANITKTDTRFIACGQGSVREVRFSRREFPNLWKDAKKERLPSLGTFVAAPSEPEPTTSS